VILPEHVRLPEELAKVQPVDDAPPATSISPVEVPPILTSPVVPASKLILVLAVLAEIAGLAPEKVRVVALKVLVFIVLDVDREVVLIAPPVDT
jgi:hypothetical protein